MPLVKCCKGLLKLVQTVSGGTDPGVNVDVHNFGRVNGYREWKVNKYVEYYLGIPFAQPPTEHLRFLPPQELPPPEDKSKEYDATKRPASCYQTVDQQFESKFVDLWNPNTNMSENCLYLNIWKPEGAADKTVLVWIYGGGFYSGTSTLELYDGDVLAAKGDVIVVSLQYRIGALGFLSLGSESAPGNVGLLDQQLALRWVHKHILDFGGDPQRVTIFGESAGAGSVSHHLLSTGSADLFQSAIMQSGSSAAPWAIVDPEEAKKRAYKLAELVGCSRDDATKCMRTKSPALLTEKQWEVQSVTGPKFSFVPTIDDKFLVKNPLELLKSGEFQRKNILLGMNSHEGSYFVIYSFPKRFDPRNEYNKNITMEEYRTMVKELRLTDSSSDLVVDTIASIYSLPSGSKGNTGDDDAVKYIMSLDGMLGDVLFKCPVIHMAKAYAREGKAGGNHKVFVYAFNHRTSASPWPQWAGDALHGYEIDHVFGRPFDDRRNQKDEEALSEKIITFWTNFAKSGDPNSGVPGSSSGGNQQWPEYNIDDRQVLVLDTGELHTQTGLRDRYCQFWSELVPKLLNATHTATDRASLISGSISLMTTAFLILMAVLVI